MINLVDLPEISVILPVYNSGQYVGRAIQSVLNQTFRNFELIIVDDGSSDNSVSIIKQFSDPRIRLYLNKENFGLSNARNLGVAVSNAPILAQFDSDGICYPNCFKKQLNFFKGHPKIGVLGAGIQIIDENGEKVGNPKLPMVDPIVLKYWLHFKNVISGPVIMYYKNLLEKVGLFNTI